MMKSALALLVVCGTVSAAAAMPVSSLSTPDSLPVAKAAVVVKKTVVRRPAAVVVRRPAPVVRSRTVIKKTVR